MIKNQSTEELFRHMNNKKVLVVGDVMIDAYLSGIVERISPEAPVPVVSLQKRISRPGGAANVAMNLRALGAKPFLCAIVGDDFRKRELIALLQENEIDTQAIVTDPSRPTTTKYRIIGNKAHLLRVDEEISSDVDQQTESALLNAIEAFLDKEKPDLIILQDYNKGVLTATVITSTIAMARERGIVTAVDPKRKNFNAFEGATLFKPNLKEFSEGINATINPEDIPGLQSITATYQQQHNIDMILLTLSEYGICYNLNDPAQKKQFGHYKAYFREISDVSGAGDTVISVAALCYVCGAGADLSTQIANIAGGLVCEYSGVVPINKEKLLSETLRVIPRL